MKIKVSVIVPVYNVEKFSKTIIKRNRNNCSK